MIAKFYFPKEDQTISEATPWKTIIPPSGDHTPTDYFLEDEQCELISEDEVAILYQDGKPIVYKSSYEWSTDPNLIDIFYNGGE